jgi:hypothetical protein
MVPNYPSGKKPTIANWSQRSERAMCYFCDDRGISISGTTEQASKRTEEQHLVRELPDSKGAKGHRGDDERKDSSHTFRDGAFADRAWPWQGAFAITHRAKRMAAHIHRDAHPYWSRPCDGAPVDAISKDGLGSVVSDYGWFTIFWSSLPLLCFRFR